VLNRKVSAFLIPYYSYTNRSSYKEMMKLQTKKIIAREFLLFLCCIGGGLIVFLFTASNNSLKKSKLDKLQNEVNLSEKNNQNLSNSHNKKIETQAWFFNKTNKKFDLLNSKYNNPDKLWERLNILIQKDSLEYKYKNSNGLRESFRIAGFENFESAKKFIQKNNLNTVEISSIQQYAKTKSKSKIIKLKSKIKEVKRSLLSENKQIDISLYGILLSFIFIFPLRHIFYSVSWSFKILKQQ
jgi:RNAse (barnase) inhibitor barstar